MSYIEAAVMGRLGGPPTQRHTQGGKPYVTFTIAVTDKGSEDTEWVNVSAFEDVAAQMPADAAKGERVYIEGRARVNRWINLQVHKGGGLRRRAVAADQSAAGCDGADRRARAGASA